MAPPARPENVLKRAEELVSMGKQADALELLYDSILSKRTRSVSLEFLEPIVLRFIDLAVELRKGKIVKDGLHQYKKLVIGTSVASLETVVDRLLSLSEAKINSAQNKADAVATADEDLEAEQSPQDVLMATVSNEQTKDRADREMVTPWLKFLWENYRSILDVLRHNSKLEDMYARVVSKAFQFCLDYQRKTEFRRLCELLRNHLQYAATQANASKSQQQAQTPGASPIDLTDPDTLQKFLDTRFAQLDVAVKLELWQEAFRSVEDIHTLLTAARRPISITYMATYFETLANIFAVSGNHLFHAAAWGQYYSMAYNTRHSAPAGYMEKVASFFLLSWLCIPLGSKGTAEVSSRSHRWAALLTLGRLPTSAGMIQSAMAKNVLSYARPEIRDLYLLLETSKFHPLTLKSDLQPIADVLGAKAKVYGPYMKPLYEVLVNRIFTELAEVYTEVSMDFLIELATLPAPICDEQTSSRQQIERLLVQGSHAATTFHVHIDYRNNSVKFVDAPTVLGGELADLAAVLSSVDPGAAVKRSELRQRIQEAAERGIKSEIEDSEERRVAHAQREKEEAAAEQAAEQQAIKERMQRQAEEKRAEEQRLADEAREREMKRIAKDRAEADRDLKRKLIEDINSKGVMRIDMSEIDKMSKDELHVLQLKQLERESRSLRDRMRSVARRYDHLERAYRREEATLWREEAAKQQDTDREAWQRRRDAIVESSKVRHEQAKAYRDRFSRMLPNYQQFIEQAESRHQEAMATKKAENAAKFEEAKEKLIAEMDAKREKEAAENKAREERFKQQEADARAREEARIKEDAERKARIQARNAANASLFGGARPVDSGIRSPAASASPSPSPSPVPSSQAAPARSSPFGRATPSAGPREVPPVSRPSAAPTPARATPRSNPFGAARPVSRPAPGAAAGQGAPGAAPAPNKFVPRHLRGDAPQGSSPAPGSTPGSTPGSGAPTPGAWVPRHKR